MIKFCSNAVCCNKWMNMKKIGKIHKTLVEIYTFPINGKYTQFKANVF